MFLRVLYKQTRTFTPGDLDQRVTPTVRCCIDTQVSLQEEEKVDCVSLKSFNRLIWAVGTF